MMIEKESVKCIANGTCTIVQDRVEKNLAKVKGALCVHAVLLVVGDVGITKVLKLDLDYNIMYFTLY